MYFRCMDRELKILGDVDPYIGKSGSKYRRVKVLCFCGKEFISQYNSVNKQLTKSCGCLRWRNRINENGTTETYYDNGRTTHGLSKHPLHKIWWGMKYRCYNETNFAYYRYGGRGIVVSDKWKDNFNAFFIWAMENGYKRGLQLDRRDNDKEYSPENCRFVTASENMRNTHKRVIVEYNGQVKHLKDWAEELGLTYTLLYSRLFAMKLPVEIAFNMRNQNKGMMINKDICDDLITTLKSDGRTQRWVVNKLKEANVETNDVRFSNQLKGITGFTEQEILELNKLLNKQYPTEETQEQIFN